MTARIAVRARGGQGPSRFGADFIVMTVGWVARAALGVLISVVTARYLAPDDLGRYAFLVWLVGLLAVVLSLGLPTTLTRYTAEAIGGHHAAAAGTLLSLIVRWQVTIVGMAAVGIAVAATLAPSSWRLLLVLAGFSLPSLVLNGSLGAFLSGLHVFRLPALVSVGMLGLLATLITVVARLDSGVGGLLVAHAVTNAIGLGVLLCLARRAGRRLGVLPASWPMGSDVRADVIRYARSTSVLVVLDALVWQRTEVAFLLAVAPSAELGFYALAFGIATQVSRIPAQASAILFPRFPALVGAERIDELAGLHARAVRYLVLLGAPLAVGLAVTASPLIRLLYGPAYDPAAPVLALLAVGSLVTVSAGASPAVLHATKHQDRLLHQGLLAAAVDLALTLALVPVAGALGAALASVAAQSLGSILAIRAAARITRASVPLAALARIVAAALAMGLVAAIVMSALDGASGLTAAILAGVGCYPLTLRALRALTAEDLERARVLVEPWPARVRASGLAIAAFLCRDPLGQPWSPSR